MTEKLFKELMESMKEELKADMKKEINEAMREYTPATKLLTPIDEVKDYSEEEDFLEKYKKAAQLYHRRTGKSLGASF